MLNPATDAILDQLHTALPSAAVRPPTDGYLAEPRRRYAGQAAAVLAPASTDEVASILRIAADARVGIIPYGGGTGLVGGQVMPDGPAPLILSLERMRAVRAVHPRENVMIVEAGMVLADIQTAAAEAGRLFPLSLASEGSARIGGLLGTNAGGVNVLRYGNARDLCLGLEAVLPDGSVHHGLKRLRKDNTGYDLRHLLIGAEGTLGVITAASLRLFPQPAEKGAAILTVPSPEAALDLLALARDRLGEGVSAFELIARASFEFLSEAVPELRQPFDSPPDWAVLIDLGLPSGGDPSAALETLFEAAHAAGLVTDGVIAQNAAQRGAFWTLREAIPEANRRIGAVSSHDISLPPEAIPAFTRRAPEVIGALGPFRINCFGHLGDGNLHYNVFPERGVSRDVHDALRPAIKRAVHDLVDEMGGSVSAEHGIGRLKVEDLQRYGDPAKLAAMRAIKDALDPIGIMNPGAVLGPGAGKSPAGA